jgi:hypothetical protein
MEKISEWVKTCLHKTRLSAGNADKIIERAKKDGVILYKYYCPHCFGYHLTKRSK